MSSILVKYLEPSAEKYMPKCKNYISEKITCIFEAQNDYDPTFKNSVDIHRHINKKSDNYSLEDF